MQAQGRTSRSGAKHHLADKQNSAYSFGTGIVCFAVDVNKGTPQCRVTPTTEFKTDWGV